MDLSLLSSTVLYFASSGAQVWAGLMVFHVLLMRDFCMAQEEGPEVVRGNDRVNVEPQRAFRIGLMGIAVNLALLASYAVVGNQAPLVAGVLGALVVANGILGYRFACQTSRALACY